MKRLFFAIASIASMSLATSCEKDKHKGLNKEDFPIKEVSEEVILSFSSAKADVDLLESYEIVFTLTKASGETDDKGNIIPYSAPSTFSIPAVFNGKGAEQISSDGYFVVEEGSDKGVLKIALKDPGFSGNLPVQVSAFTAGNSLIHDGDQTDVLVHVKGYLRLEDIAGTWEFKEVLNLEEIEMWYEEMEEPAEDLPTHNAGFALTFAKEAEGWSVTPSGEGDWNNYFAKSSISLTSPKQEWLTKDTGSSRILGTYTAEERNQFVTEVASAYQQTTFFELSNVDRSFSGNGTMGKGAISMRLVDGELEIAIKDYDAPDWDIAWWDPGFDSEMHSFVSRFTKKN